MHPLFDKDEQMMNRVCSVDRNDKYQSHLLRWSQEKFGPKMKSKNNYILIIHCESNYILTVQDLSHFFVFCMRIPQILDNVQLGPF